MAAIDPNFSAYLTSLEPYRNLFQVGFWAGVIIIIVGVVLTFVMRNHNKQDRVQTNIDKVYVNFGSNNPGSIVVLVGGAVIWSSLWVTKYSIPKVTFTQGGWTTAESNSSPDMVKAARLYSIGESSVTEVMLSAVTSVHVEVPGFLLPANKKKALQDAGIESFDVKAKQIDPKIKSAAALKDGGDALFVSEASLFRSNDGESKKKEDLYSLVKKASSGEATIKISPRSLPPHSSPRNMEIKRDNGSQFP